MSATARPPVAPALHHAPTWLGPAPLWDRARGRFPAEPRILRFASDHFMEELTEALRQARPDLAALEVQAGSDLEPGGGAPAAGALPRLFQPAHGRFYLVAASLVCEAPGLPDRRVDPSLEEQVGFVVRRLATADGREVEQAWRRAAGTERGSWAAPRGGPDVVADDETLHPLFPVTMQVEGRRRRCWAGLVPTSSRETYEDPAAGGFEDGDPDPRPGEADVHVLVPYESLRAQGAAGGAVAREASSLLLRDFAAFLRDRADTVWAALAEGAPAPAGTEAAGLAALLHQARVAGPGSGSWAAALRSAPAGDAGSGLGDASAPGPEVWLGDLDQATLRRRLVALFAEQPFTPPAAPAAPAPELPALGADQRYVIRCVQRCLRCRPWRRDVVSARSRAFTLAPYFDADAPARQVRIAMPADTSLAALRRFKKGVGLVLSPKLRAQLARIQGLKDGKLDLVDEQATAGGQVCMLSLPIITIVAMVLLMVFVALLNLVFWWLPLFKICLPLKKGGG